MSSPEHRYASAQLSWPAEISNLELKQQVAERAVELVRDGQTIGIGSGSNAYLVLWAIGDRVKREHLNITVVTTSYETDTAAFTLGIPTVPLGSVRPVWGVDGADEVDPARRLLKGRGGAMFKEKVLWHTAQKMFLAVDQSKHVERLGQGFPIPIEVDRAAVELLAQALQSTGATSHGLRLAGGKDGPVFTESGNLIVDAWYDQVPDGLHAELKALPGVIETGLFEGYDFEIL